MSHARRWSLLLVVVLGSIGSIIPAAPPAAAAGMPTLRLITSDPHVTIQRYGRRAWLDVGVYVAAVGGAFDVRIQRADYDHPMEVTQHVAGGSDVALPSSVARSLVGLRRFLHITVTDRSGRVVLDRFHAFCPSGEVRVDDGGPATPSFPGSCYGSPFTLGTVWGLDDGWATEATSAYGDTIKGPDGRYTVHVEIPDRYVTLFGIAPEDAQATVRVKIVTVGNAGCPPFCPAAGASHPRRASVDAPSDAVPTLPDPSPDVEPDLVALPAWGITIQHRRSGDFLDFGATVWNAGPAPLVVEGFRRPGEPTMDAYQYFTDETGAVVGKAEAGDMAWDPRPGHRHWHFEQFARYSLLDASQTTTVVSRKEAFCLAPTDAIDLLAPRAVWNPDAIGFGGSNCGYGPSALWAREALPTGWGDTYFQGLPGQSFDISDLPNGTYYIAVQANPLGVLHEVDASNDLELREIRLGGRPGHRTVRVPPWHGIDTEGSGGGFVGIP